MIDAVIRTSAAGIFGYFISVNFAHKKQIRKKKTKTNIGEEEKNELETLVSSKKTDCTSLDEMGEKNGSDDVYKPPKSQVLVIAAVGILSLVFLIVARNGTEIGETAIATLSQLRDFVSASIGFLMGRTSPRK